ncbi:hypothetical protein SAMN05216389_101384 [Oceanobacillus limi]|uniref:Uncharacterized protein n=1 Tax=Oceanobacillus limi TaxID=930131 RepID=A0A1H9YGD1_9BACI|nr:hypothetical protein SAMN05216389_101384 [Oceanobacillus limi]
MSLNLVLIIGVMIAFLTAMFTAGYDAKPGVPKNNQ